MTTSDQKNLLEAKMKEAIQLISDHCDACVIIASWDDENDTLRFTKSRGNLHACRWLVHEAAMEQEELQRSITRKAFENPEE